MNPGSQVHSLALSCLLPVTLGRPRRVQAASPKLTGSASQAPPPLLTLCLLINSFVWLCKLCFFFFFVRKELDCQDYVKQKIQGLKH